MFATPPVLAEAAPQVSGGLHTGGWTTWSAFSARTDMPATTELAILYEHP